MKKTFITIATFLLLLSTGVNAKTVDGTNLEQFSSIVLNEDSVELFQIIQIIIADKAGLHVDEVRAESHLMYDLGLDSLDRFEIVMECEKEFGINIPPEMSEKFVYVIDVYNYINSRVG